MKAGEIKQFTGVDSPYEPPLAPDIELRTDRESVSQSMEKVAELALRLARPPEPAGGGEGADI